MPFLAGVASLSGSPIPAVASEVLASIPSSSAVQSSPKKSKGTTPAPVSAPIGSRGAVSFEKCTCSSGSASFNGVTLVCTCFSRCSGPCSRCRVLGSCFLRFFVSYCDSLFCSSSLSVAVVETTPLLVAPTTISMMGLSGSTPVDSSGSGSSLDFENLVHTCLAEVFEASFTPVEALRELQKLVLKPCPARVLRTSLVEMHANVEELLEIQA